MIDSEMSNGAFIVARKMFDSELWLRKPSSWKVIWIYILGNVSHKDTSTFRRGVGFFNFADKRTQIGSDISYDTIKKCLTFLKVSTMISTKRSTRGMYVEVLNYNKYQLLDNYKSTTESTTQSTSGAPPAHHRSTPIHKNVRIKEIKKKTSSKEEAKDVLLTSRISKMAKPEFIRLREETLQNHE
jgi:hypothetical protein